MATTLEKRTVNAAGLVQGIALVTFPAASTIFTAPNWYDLSSSQYGTMFVPQVITAVTTSLLGTTLASRYGSKSVYVAGLAADLASMLLLIGYGVAAFGVGPVHNAGVGLPAIFAASAVVAVAMGALSFVVAFRRPSPASLHTRPAATAVVST